MRLPTCQPRPQGAFPWLWGRGPKAREKRPGDEVADMQLVLNIKSRAIMAASSTITLRISLKQTANK